jgi:hypothetical protein
MLTRQYYDPATNFTDVNLLRKQVRLTDDADLDLILEYADVATIMLEEYVNKLFIQREVIWVMARDDQNFRSNIISNGMSSMVTAWDWGALYRWLPLPKPASAVSEVRIGIFGCNDIILTEGVDYNVELKANVGRIQITNWSMYYTSVSYMQVTFTSGFGPLPTDVPKPIHQAVRLMVTRMKENLGDTNFDLYIDAVETLCSPYKTYVIGGGCLSV